MPTGFKDWDIPVNINSQSLAETTNRPKYGGSVGAVLTKNVPAGQTMTLVTLSGKGMIYGGWIRGINAVEMPEAMLQLYLDGALIQYNSWEGLNLAQIDKAHMAIMYLTLYDNATYKYCVGISYGYTFEQSLKIEFVNDSAGAAGITGRCFYALI